MTFAEQVLDILKNKYNKNVGFKIVTKNGKEKLGIIFTIENSIATPVVYPDQYEDMGPDEAAQAMIKAVDLATNDRASINTSKDEIESIMENWEKYALYETLSKDKRRLIIHFPGTHFLTGSIPNHTYTEEELEKFTLTNFLMNYITIGSFIDVLLGNTKKGGYENLPKTIDKNEMVIVSGANIKGSTGMILNPRILQFICETYNYEDGIYVLPSSIHEVMIFDKNGEMGPEELLNMMKSVNQMNGENSIELYEENIYSFDYGADTIENCF